MLKNTVLRSFPLKTLSSAFLVNKTDYLYQQTRSTFILKRRNEPRLHKKHEKRAKLTARNFLYDLIEDTDNRPQRSIDLVLTSNVEQYGSTGDLVSEKVERAYNKLLLPKLAVYATPENIEKYHIQRDVSQTYSSPYVQKALQMLTSWIFCTIMSNNVPWTLEKWHMRVTFRRNGFVVPEEAITMPEKPISGPDESLDGKYFFVKVKINNREEAKVKCKLLHANYELKCKSVKEISVDSSEPIFEEDRVIPDSPTTTPMTSV